MNENPEINKLLNILSVEDSVRDYELICELLTDGGYNFNITRVDKKDELKDLISGNRYDIILCDFKLPGFDAFAALNLCNEICPDVPFICVSGSIGEETAIELIKQGAEDYVLKDRPQRLPFSMKRALDEAEIKKEHGKVQKELIESEQNYRTLADSGRALVWTSGTDKLANYFNKVWLEFTGCKLKDQTGNGWQKNVHPDDLKRRIDIYERSFDRRERFIIEYRIKQYDGKYRWVIDDASPRYNSRGEFIGYIGHCLDVTERILAADRLRETEERFRMIFENSLDCFLLNDTSGDVIMINPAGCRMFGRTAGQIQLKGRDGIFDVTDPLFKTAIELREKNGYYSGEITGIKANGEKFPIEVTSVFYTDHKKRKRAWTIIRDITERRKAEEAKTASEIRYRRLFESAKDGILILNAETGQIIDVNPFLIDLLGYSFAQFTGKAIWDIGFFKDIIANQNKFLELQQKEYVRYEDSPLVTADGRVIHVEFVSNVYLVNHYKVIQCNIRDITERKLAQKALQESERFAKNTVNALDINIAIIDEHGVIIAVNNAWRSFNNENNGDPARANEGVNYLEICDNAKGDSSEGAAEVAAAIRAVIARTTDHYKLEYPCNSPDTIRWFSLTANRFQGDGPVRVVVSHNNITDRKIAEDEVKFKNILLSTQQETWIDGIFAIDENGKIISWNNRFLNMWGLSSEEIDAKSGENVLRAAVRMVNNPDQYLDKVNYLFKHTNEISHDEINFLDGRCFERYTAPMIAANEKYYGRVWYFHDISNRKKNVEKIKKANRLYAVLSEINKTIIRIKDEKELFEIICRVAVDTGGFRFVWIGTKDSITGCVTPVAQCGFSDSYLEEINITQPQGKQEVCDCIEKGISAGKLSICNDIKNDERKLPCQSKALKREYSSSAVFPLTRFGSNYGVIVLYSSQTGFFDEEEINLLQELSNDISFSIDTIEREIQKQKAEKERDRFFNYSMDMMAISKFDGYSIQLNPAWEKTLGWSMEELLAKPYIEFVHPEDKKSFVDRISMLSTGKQPEPNIINRFLCKDGTYKWLSRNSVPIPEEKLIFTVARDITAQIENENELKNLEAQLIQAQKLESLGTMAGGIAHDFNNILNIIMGYASILKMPDCDNNEVFANSEIILDASKRGADLVKQLLTFARKSESVLESVQVNSTITEIKKLLNKTFPKTIEIKCELQDDLPFITADNTQIHQIFLNLCVNARDAMPKGGSITISTKLLNGDEAKAKYPMAETGEYIEIQVADTGTGMDETVKKKIFDPFFTTKEAGKGTGLGLALVYGIVKSFGGLIDLVSEPGKGTSFYICLPVQKGTDEIHLNSQRIDDESLQGTGTILLIEDEKISSDLLTNIFIINGYKVITAYDGLQGIDMYQKRKEEITVTISDLGLPNLGGDEVFAQIKAINPQAKIILISGFIDLEVKARLLEAGARYIIQKPYEPNKILRTIKEILMEKQE